MKATGTCEVFTCGRIAEVMQRDRSAVEAKLIGAPVSARVTEEGKRVKAWAWRAIPEDLRAKLDEEAARQGYGSGQDLLLYGSPDWAKIPAQVRDRVARVAKAMRRPLSKAALLPPPHLLGARLEEAKSELEHLADLVEIGLEAYKAEFGYAIQPASWWEILTRVLRRDAGARRFERLHIYLPEQLQKTVQRRRALAPDLAELHAPLLPDVDQVKDRMAPTSKDEMFLFAQVFRHWDALQQRLDLAGKHPQVKAAMVDWLLAAVPGLSLTQAGAPSREGLRRKFDRLYARWVARGRSADAIRDLREVHSGRQGYSCPECMEKVHNLSVHLRRNTTRAWRELYKRGLLCPLCYARYSLDMRKDKSYVPASVRRAATPSQLTFAVWKSPRDGELVGPHIRRDYSGVLAGDVTVLDDLTCNEPVWEPGPAGGFDIFYPQMIAATDFACGLAHPFVMHKGHPHGWGIQRALYQVFVNGPGLPRRGMYLEHGVFDSEKVNKVLTEAGIDPREFNEFAALFEFMREPSADESRETSKRLRVIRARLPRGKTIEGDLGIWQRQAAQLPGHTGFNQRLENFAVRQDFLDRCRSGKEHPRNEGILSLDEYRAKWVTLLEEYNAEPQNGRRNPGISPQERWNMDVQAKPLDKLPQRLWPILASNVHRVRVGACGVKIPLGRHDYGLYASEDIKCLEGQQVRVFVNIDFPERALVTDPKAARFRYIVPRIEAPALDATKEDFKRVEGLKSGFMSEARYLAGNVRNPMQFWVERDSEFTEEAGQVADALTQAAATAQSKRNAGTRAESSLRRQAQDSGAVVRPGVDLANARHQRAAQLAIKARQLKQKEASL